MYPACKFALTALTECLRQEVSYIEMGIKVSVRIKYMNKIIVDLNSTTNQSGIEIKSK